MKAALVVFPQLLILFLHAPALPRMVAARKDELQVAVIKKILMTHLYPFVWTSARPDLVRVLCNNHSCSVFKLVTSV